MPLVRIDLDRNAPTDRARIVGDAVYKAMRAVANVPENDRFQIITRHDFGEIIYPDEGYLGVKYSSDLVMIQVTWVGGRSTEIKKTFYKMIADEIHEKANIRRDDVWITLVDNAREDWSFGGGVMQYAP
jgi:4-oxalocrotonate tautomerase